MGQGISEVLTFAIGVAVSPIPIIAVILMLFSQRAKVNGPAFLVGWVVALVAVSTVVYVLAHDGDVATSSTATDSVSWGKIALRRALARTGAAQLAQASRPGRGTRHAGVAPHGGVDVACEGLRPGRRARRRQPEEPDPHARRGDRTGPVGPVDLRRHRCHRSLRRRRQSLDRRAGALCRLRRRPRPLVARCGQGVADGAQRGVAGGALGAGTVWWVRHRLG